MSAKGYCVSLPQKMTVATYLQLLPGENTEFTTEKLVTELKNPVFFFLCLPTICKNMLMMILLLKRLQGIHHQFLLMHLQLRMQALQHGTYLVAQQQNNNNEDDSVSRKIISMACNFPNSWRGFPQKDRN